MDCTESGIPIALTSLPMINWLLNKIRTKLREWLKEEAELSFDLDCWMKTKGGCVLTNIPICGVRGMHLLGETESGTQLIGIGQAIDRPQFNRLWKHFHRNVEMQWEDGEAFDPSG